MDRYDTVNTWQLTRYFFPLAIQAIAQAFTHPLVAMVASRGPGGPLNLAGLAQSSMVMFFLGMFAIYYVTTGMVYAKNRQDYDVFWRVCVWTGLGAITIQGLLGLSGPSHLLFSKFIGLPPSIAAPARITLLAGIPVQFLFFLRIPYQVLMYNGKATGLASIATLMRIVLTAALVPVFVYAGLVGPIWAVICLTIPVVIEVIFSFAFARPFLKRLENTAAPSTKPGNIFLFNLPLSIGGYFLVVSTLVLSAFIARSPEPERILPVYFLALGLANPVTYAATRIQAVVLAFPPTASDDHSALKFALMAGAVLGISPLIFIIPGLIELYYVELQKLPITDLGLVRVTAVALVCYPLSVAFRAHREGLAAFQKKPRAVLIGHGCFMIAIILVGYLLWKVGVPGYLIGALGLTLGSLTSSSAIQIALKYDTRKPIPVGQTTTPVGLVR